MKVLVGVTATHDEAVAAIDKLKKAGYPAAQLSLITKADLIDGHIHIKSSNTPEKAEMSIGIAAGAVLGILTGVGVFLIPGLGFLYGAGALIGVFAGVDLGLLGGGIAAILTSIGVDEGNTIKYENYLNEGKFLVFAQGSDAEIKQAEGTLHQHDLELEVSVY
jgi:hypothetical protein